MPLHPVRQGVCSELDMDDSTVGWFRCCGGGVREGAAVDGIPPSETPTRLLAPLTWQLTDIIHDFGDTEILLWYKHVEMTMF